MASVEIFAAKIKRKDFIEYEYFERSDAGSQTVKVDADNIIHEDLRTAFYQLVPHLVLILEEIDDDPNLERAIDDISRLSDSTALWKILDKYKVTAIKLNGLGEGQGVVITGSKRLSNDKTVILNTPVVKWEDEYQYANELKIAVERLTSEVILYADGKRAPDAQGDLFAGEPEDADKTLAEK